MRISIYPSAFVLKSIIGYLIYFIPIAYIFAIIVKF